MAEFRLKRSFSIQLTPSKVKTYPPGVYSVPSEMPNDHALTAVKHHKGSWIEVKKPPENKIVAPAENKAGVGGKPVRRRRTRTQPDD